MLETLKSRLLQGIVMFSFVKADGEKRVAYGTLNQNLIPKYDEVKVTELIENSEIALNSIKVALDNQDEFEVQTSNFTEVAELLDGSLKPFRPKEPSNRAKNDALVTYYDLEKRQFRSFKAESLKEVF